MTNRIPLLMLFTISSMYSMEQNKPKKDLSTYQGFLNALVQDEYNTERAQENMLPAIAKKIGMNTPNIPALIDETIKLTYQNNNPIITREYFDNLFAQFKETSKQHVQNAQWLENHELPADFFDKSLKPLHERPATIEAKDYYVPFEKTLMLGTNGQKEKAYLFGDLHGGIFSLTESLNKLNAIDKNSFKLNDKNTHLVFLGDLVDRGAYGLETVCLLMNLYTANPKNVHIIRGNHEDLAINKPKDGFSHELDKKLGQKDQFNEVRASNKLLAKVRRFYDFLPHAIWIGTHTFSQPIRNIPLFGKYFFNKFSNWHLATHGGLEIGDKKLPELFTQSTAQKDTVYKRIGDVYHNQDKTEVNTWLCRKENYDKIRKTVEPLIDKQRMGKQGFSDEGALLNPTSDEFPAGELGGLIQPIIRDFRIENPADMGYAWNDCSHEDILRPSDRGTGIEYGKTYANAVLNLFSSRFCKAKGVFRAHQHQWGYRGYKNSLMKKLIENKNAWASFVPEQSNDKHHLSQGAVVTLGVTADGIYGIPQQVSNEELNVKDCPKNYPGVISYGPEKLTFKPGKCTNTLTAKKKDFTILPKELCDAHTLIRDSRVIPVNGVLYECFL